MAQMLARGGTVLTGGRMFVVMIIAVYSMTSLTSAWGVHLPPSNLTASFFAANLSFRVYLTPDEVLEYIMLPGYNCSIVDEQIFVKTVSALVQGTLVQWNHEAPPEKNDFILRMHCTEVSARSDIDSPTIEVTSITMITATTTSSSSSSSSSPSTSSSSSPPSPEPRTALASTTLTAVRLTDTASNDFVSEKKNHSVADAVTISTLEGPAILTSPIEEEDAIVGMGTEQDRGDSKTDKTDSAVSSSLDNVTTTMTRAPSPTVIVSSVASTASLAPGEPLAPVSSMEAIVVPTETKSKRTTINFVPRAKPTGSTKAQQVSDRLNIGDESMPNQYTNDSKSVFTLMIYRLSMDYIHGQKFPTYEKVLNFTEELELALFNDTPLPSEISSNSSIEAEQHASCVLLPKEVRIFEAQYVLLVVGFNSSTGEPIRAGSMARSCGYEDWYPARDFILETAHIRLLDAKLLQLQLLSISLVAVVIAFVLLAVFLCTKWRLAVRGSRREASDEFYIKTFHTKEHQYVANSDDFYGFPTIRRDSTFYRSLNNSNTTPNSIRGNSFVNGAFQDGEDHQSLPAPPLELQTCIINDANFTDVPLHNFGSDSLRAHRGAHRHQSPPLPPLRTVSSGYMSGQSTPAVEYHNSHDVVILPSIPKEDYSDSDNESSPVPLSAENCIGIDGGGKGRLTVRTAL